MRSLARSASDRLVQAPATPAAARTCRKACSRSIRSAVEQRAWLPPRSGAVAQAQERDAALMTIEDLDSQYCDDFECTSSPAVEQTVRTVARDLQRGAYTRAAFQPDAAFDDGFRSFKGTGRLARGAWLRDVMKDPKVSVSKMRMLDRGTAEIEWRVAGQVAMFSVQVPCKTVLEMNLLTGRVTSLKESWDTGAVGAPAAAALMASRAAWAAQQASRDAQEGLNKTLDSISSMASTDEDTIYRDPTDPTRFFRQEDSTMQDAVSLGLLLAVLYVAYKAYSTLLGA
ncbi:MAG: hypothetical protein J3K34DRAFT_461205 [Monoraphidium minutum]|nr:MAG: hypothetical protein J3K34DRAFT_461205 [Monoraphidium minutum]